MKDEGRLKHTWDITGLRTIVAGVWGEMVRENNQ